MTAITLDSVSKTYDGDRRVVDGLRLRVEDGEFLVLLGPRGCGKSTVLRMIAGLEEITDGRLWLGETLANELPPHDRRVAMLSEPGASAARRDVRRDPALPLEIGAAGPGELREKVAELLRGLGSGPPLDRRPGLFLMDEPLSGLDASLRTELRLEIGRRVRGLGITTIYVTHDQMEALTLADRVAVLRDGALEDVGTPTQVHDDPATAFVAAFLGGRQIALLSATVADADAGGVVLRLGAQSIRLPHTDPRARPVAAHLGETVIVGVRADALRPTGDPHLGTVLSGVLRRVEYHGHAWMAHVDAGVPVVNGMRLGALPAAAARRNETMPPVAAPDDAGPAGHGRVEAVRRWAGRTAASVRLPGPLLRDAGVLRSAGGLRGPLLRGPLLRGPLLRDAGGPRDRGSELLARLDSHHGWDPGDPIHLTVDLPRLLFFDSEGRRIDRLRR